VPESALNPCFGMLYRRMRESSVNRGFLQVTNLGS
jgi:hypothetical protein